MGRSFSLRFSILFVVVAIWRIEFVHCSFLPKVETVTEGVTVTESVPVPVVVEPEIDVKFSNSTLELLHVIFRHGPRTPVNTYPNDPYINDTFFPYGWGHLTNDGKKELFGVGKWLRKRYKKFLEPYYSPDMLYAQSSASPRTLMSISTVLASMFPPKKTPMEWNERYNWQPIPIFSEPQETDILLRQTASCPRYEEAYKEVLNLPEVQNELSEYTDLFEELTKLTGENVTSAADINSIYITLLAEKLYGLELPEWTKDYYPEKMEFLAAQNYIYNVYTPEMQRIKGGPFLKQMFEDMQGKIDGNLSPKGRKIFMYCAHDWSISNILHALGAWKRQLPGFSSLIAFELHKDQQSDEYFIEIWLKNNANAPAELITVPGCDARCPLNKLLELSKNVMPIGTYSEMCQSKET